MKRAAFSAATMTLVLVAVVSTAAAKSFTPYGVSVGGLSYSDDAASEQRDDQMIDAAHAAWHANTIRLQVGQHNLVSDQPGFVAQLRREVSRALNLRMRVVINDQTEYGHNEPEPTSDTAAFWWRVSDLYGRDQRVIFDLFNEWRSDRGWAPWQRSMQSLVDLIRDRGARNTIWAEGPYWASNLSQVPRYHLRGLGIVYAIHHPGAPHMQRIWDRVFGNTAKRYPVVIGEWTNWASSGPECWPDAPTAVPRFLGYVAARHLGMIVWRLWPGQLTSTTDLTQPSDLRADWACRDGLNESVGAILQRWFAAQTRSGSSSNHRR
jgi:hypothetical protein